MRTAYLAAVASIGSHGRKWFLGMTAWIAGTSPAMTLRLSPKEFALIIPPRRQALVALAVSRDGPKTSAGQEYVLVILPRSQLPEDMRRS
jgi:hypothetical protein